MFASLKNKIREETGSDLSKLTAKITSSTVQKIDSLRGRSHQGSSSSINSIVSSDGLRDENNTQAETDEFRKRFAKLELDFARKLDQKEQEWREILNEKEKRLQAIEKQRSEALQQVVDLRNSLKLSEESKQKLVVHQEDTEQIESFQIQELAKVKHLVLLREKELAEKTGLLKEANAQLDKLRQEVNRLRRQEELLSDVQDDLEALRHSSARDLAALATELAKCEEERRHLSDLVVVLRQRVANETSIDEHFISERKLLEQRLEEAHLHLADIKTSWSDKIASLETQVGRLSRQAAEEGAERRRAVQEKEVLNEKIKQMEAELEYNRLELNNKDNKIERLTNDVNELSKELKNLQAENEEEVTFLRTQLEDANTEVKIVKKNLENTENELGRSEEENGKLKLSVDSEHETNRSLRELITRLEKELGEEKENSLNVQKTLARVTTEKNAALLRNAEISQQMEMVKQSMRRQEGEMTDLLNRVAQIEKENEEYKESSKIEQQLRGNIGELEEQLGEKNKNIKTLQLRLADMKKALQQELKTPGSFYQTASENNHFDAVAILTPSQISTRTLRKDEDDVNFKYLKHVVIKFLTSREYEAQHLTKAIATLLKFTPDEERLVIDTLEWRRSWWFGGSRPKLAQKTRTIPSS